jgi:thiol-disulfide isomerase/thioredoxin
MKKLFVVLLAGGMFAACATKSAATIDGTVTGVADGTKVFLLDNTRAKLDSTVIKGGKFRFEIAKAYPDHNSLSFEGIEGSSHFFIEPGVITAVLDMSGYPNNVTERYSGTPSNDALAKYRTEMAAFGDYSEMEAHVNKTIIDNPGTVFAANLLLGGAHSLTTPAEIDSVLNIIAGAPANAFSDQLKERRGLLAASAVGQPAPDFTQNQPDGTPFSLLSLKGKLVLIDFWASWCGPCRAENPNVVKVYNKYHDKGFEILGVSLDDSREDWLQAIEDDGLVWKHVSDLAGWRNAVAQQYAVSSIPHTVLVGADGVIVAKNLRGEALEAKVAEVLGAATAN